MIETSDFPTKVGNYFDSTLRLYYRYSNEHFHFGFWNEKTSDLKEALINTIRYIGDLLDIKKEDVVLDAGCGIGGSARFIATNFGVRTIGINISASQVKLAKKLSSGIKNSPQLEFYKQDFAKTTFPNEYFTKIFAIESVCHAPSNIDFFQEAFRLLRNGGKLVIADGFRTRTKLSNEERKLAAITGRGWAVPNLDSPQVYMQKLRKIGFQNVAFQDKTKEIVKTAWFIHKAGKKWYPITFLLSRMKLIPQVWHYHTISCYNQLKLINKKICIYGVCIAEK